MSDSLELFLSDSSSHGIDSLWRTVEKQMSISVSVSNPEINTFDDREAVWLPCKGKSSALARNLSMRSPGKVYSKEAVWLPCKGKSSALARNLSMRSPGKVYSK
ncbi:hypothetical protein T07_6832 [Trichinella nelsoni]|uniref:Uncharacterized protein n=1 Tax=Trichinella nelsoni TaxID=6336 RepID=A0A0V0RGE5_9BILA|nr:hypothetical protein T07_6832 [Trichinella nelsoni]